MATSPRPFQQDDKKYENSSNIFKRKAKTGKKDNKSADFWGNFEDYIAYYRLNPQRFCTEYFGLNLHWWQQFILWCMWFNYNFIFLATRGCGKSWLTIVFCIAYGTLYPGVTIGVGASTKKQSSMLLAKAKELQKYPMVAREIADISISNDGAVIKLHSGSEIVTVVANSNARGLRTQVFIVDEANDVDQDIVEKVFVPFLTATRKPPYLSKKEYSNSKEVMDIEHNHFIKLSSIGSKSSKLYEEFERYIGYIEQGLDDYSVFSLPYQIPMKSGVISKKLIEKMVRESTRGAEAFNQEMSVIPTGENESSMFTFESMNKNRRLRLPLYPITDDEWIEYKGDIKRYPYYQKKEDYEQRIISYDIATASGSTNDLSVFSVFRIIQNGEFYEKSLVYIETMSGVDTEQQILRFKQLFYTLECDNAVIDAQGVGRVFVQLACKKTTDIMRSKVYPAWSLLNNQDKFDNIQIQQDSYPVLYTVIMSGASAQQAQAVMVQKARFNFEKKMISLLETPDGIEVDLQKRYKYKKLISSARKEDNDLALRLVAPFAQTSKLIEEGISTQVLTTSNGVSIDEKNGRKDRLMSFLYGMLFIDLLEQDLQMQEEKIDYSKLIAASQGNKTNNHFNSNFKGFRR